jgi:hypothetical protein
LVGFAQNTINQHQHSPLLTDCYAVIGVVVCCGQNTSRVKSQELLPVNHQRAVKMALSSSYATMSGAWRRLILLLIYILICSAMVDIAAAFLPMHPTNNNKNNKNNKNHCDGLIPSQVVAKKKRKGLNQWKPRVAKFDYIPSRTESSPPLSTMRAESSTHSSGGDGGGDGDGGGFSRMVSKPSSTQRRETTNNQTPEQRNRLEAKGKRHRRMRNRRTNNNAIDENERSGNLPDIEW